MTQWIIPTSNGKAIKFVQVGEPIVCQPQRYAVRDTMGGWICSRHKNWDLAYKRARDCNKRAAHNGDCSPGYERYKVEPYNGD